MAGKFDAAIKDLMWRGMPALLGLLVKIPVARILSPDFSVVKERRPDLLAELVDRGLLHLEFQAQDVRRSSGGCSTTTASSGTGTTACP